MKKTICHGDSQSVSFKQGRNGATLSEAMRIFADAQNWTAAEPLQGMIIPSIRC